MAETSVKCVIRFLGERLCDEHCLCGWPAVLPILGDLCAPVSAFTDESSLC